jgi:hypothetical protein
MQFQFPRLPLDAGKDCPHGMKTLIALIVQMTAIGQFRGWPSRAPVWGF